VPVNPQIFGSRLRRRQITKQADFVIQFCPPRRGVYRIQVLSSPAGEGSGTFAIPTRRLHPDPEVTGANLYSELLKERVGELFAESRGMLSGCPANLLSIKLRIDPEDPKLAPIASLEWETLFDPMRHLFLSLSDNHCIVRELDAPAHRRTLKFPSFIRILSVISNPRDATPLDVDLERRKIEDACKGVSGVAVTFLKEPTIAALRRALLTSEADGGFHVLHFAGHGNWSAAEGQGYLLFETTDGLRHPVSAFVLADLVARFKTLQVIVLNACDTGVSMPGAKNPYAGVAEALILRGFPAVLAMQSRVSDQAAIAFSGSFYEYLAKGYPLEKAVTEGRLAIRRIPSVEWKVPVLFLRTAQRPGVAWLRIAAGSLILVAGLSLFVLFRPPEQTTIFSFDLQDGAIVGTETTVTGTATNPNLHYYLLVRDPSRRCWLQTNGPLIPDHRGRWSVHAHFSGNPGQTYELIAVASSRSLTNESLVSCAESEQGLKRFVRVVRVEPNPSSP
jgi:hypothetical protein